MENKNNKGKRNESDRIVGGVILVAVGIALLLRNTGFLLPSWLFTWPVIVILAGIYTGFKNNFRNPSWLIVVGVGFFFLIQRYIPSINLQPYFWPLIIIGVGVVYIISPKKKSWNSCKRIGEDGNNKWGEKTTWQNLGEDVNIDGNDEFRVSSVFSGVKKNIISKNFKSGQISTVFGGAEIDLTQADLTGTAVIRMEVVFGGVTILVPPHWSVQNDIDGVFHSVEDNRNSNASTVDTGKVLILQGRCVFGGIEIKSY
jgi:predicted membrane protein